MAYFELNLNKIVEKYCVNKDKPKLKCNGKCHLSKRLLTINTTKDQNHKKAIHQSLTEAFIPVFFQEYPLEDFLRIMEVYRPKFHYFNRDYILFLSNHSPPPQA